MNSWQPLRVDANFSSLFDQVSKQLIEAEQVNTGHWQAKKDTPMSETRELTNCVFEVPIAGSPGAWAGYMEPNLPWAEDHFEERVSGVPHNPPPSHVYWPFNQRGNKDHMEGMEGEIFSHTYPERMWPRYAASDADDDVRFGIRYAYGDLMHAVQLLSAEPHTRQCYVPIWFPEDLCAAAVHHQRVPCTLGYHILLRNNRLNVFYPIRSLDWLRYARDDFYMAGRLTHWFIDKCRTAGGENSVWHEVNPGKLTVHAVSLHIFEGDVQGLTHRLSKVERV